MKNNLLVKVCISLGFVVYLLAWVHKFIMTMDIPISFSNGEAIVLYILLFISVCMILTGSFGIQRKQNRNVLIAMASILLILNASTFKIGVGTEYFSPAYAQLIIAFILHNVIVIGGNILFLKGRRHVNGLNGV